MIGPGIRRLSDGAAKASGAFTSSRNLTIKVTSATALSVSADAALLENAKGQVRRFSTVSETINITSSGAGGLDTGSEAVSTWYAVHLIGKEDGTLAGLLSASATAPTLPTGYTYFAPSGWVRNDSSGNLLRTIKHNDWVQYIIGTNPSAAVAIISGTVSVGEIDLSSYVPATAIEVDVSATTTGVGTGSYTCELGPSSASIAGNGTTPLYANTPSNSPLGPIRGRMVLETAQKLYGRTVGTGIGLLFGYRDAI